MEKEYICYKITNKINGKVYIGQTRRKINMRWNSHVYNAKKGVRTHFYSALRKYKPNSFDVVIIANALTIEHLNDLEILLIAQYDSFEKGYNSTSGGSVPTHRTPISEATRKKLSNASKGKSGFQGHKHTASTKEKMRTAHLGNTYGLGYKHTKEAKDKISNASRGNTHAFGNRHSDSSKIKMSQVQRGLNNANSKGYVFTPFGTFKSLSEASKTITVCSRNIIAIRCRSQLPQWSGWYYDKPAPITE